MFRRPYGSGEELPSAGLRSDLAEPQPTRLRMRRSGLRRPATRTGRSRCRRRVSHPIRRKPWVILGKVARGREAGEPLLVAGMAPLVIKMKRCRRVLLIMRWRVIPAAWGRYEAHEFVEAGIEPRGIGFQQVLWRSCNR